MTWILENDVDGLDMTFVYSGLANGKVGDAL